MTPKERRKCCKEIVQKYLEIEAAKILAQMMKEKGIKWEWEKGDWYYCDGGVWLYHQGSMPDNYIPIPTFERCLKLLKEWRWQLSRLVFNFDSHKYHCELMTEDDFIAVTSPDPAAAAILACIEAVRRAK